MKLHLGKSNSSRNNPNDMKLIRIIDRERYVREVLENEVHKESNIEALVVGWDN